MKYFTKASLIFAGIFSFYFAACGGSSQIDGDLRHKPEEIIKFAKKVEKTLANKGAKVAILARVGSPRSKLPDGISFTHVGIAVYSQVTAADDRKITGYTIHNLYQRKDEPDISDLIRDYPADFFKAVYELEAGIIIPSPKLQKKILKTLASPTYKNLHNPKYSLIANPYTTELQNCTEHTLDVVVAAIYQTNDIKEIKANQKAYFEPQPVNINPVKLWLSSMFVADVAVTDHPGSPVTATYTTIGNFFKKYDAGSEVFIVAP